MLYLIKIGGSLITDKTKPYTTRPEVIKTICKEIAELIQHGHRIIIGNGAGSFGHFSAQKYGTAQGLTNEQSTFGLAQVQYDAVELNHLLVQTFLNNSTPVFTFAPSSFIQLENGVAGHVDISLIQQAMKSQLTPFLYGDVVLDSVRGCGILSTDILFEELGKKLSLANEQVSVISVGDYDGVLDSENNLIKHISATEDTSKYWRKSENIDVTGGMKTKVESMQRLVKECGIQSIILNGGVAGRLTAVIEGKETDATIIGN